MLVDWPQLVSGQDIILTAPPSDSYQGLLLGNGDIAVSLFGPPELLTLHVGKNDIWDYRDPMDEKRPRTHQEFLAKYADPSQPPVLHYLQDARDDPWNEEIRQIVLTPTPTIKPAGRIRFRNHSLEGAQYRGRLRLWDAEATAELRPSQSAVIRTFVSYPRNLIVVEYAPSGEQHFDIEIARHHDSTGTIPDGPEFGVSGRDLWVRYKFPADPVNYPQGFEYVMMGRVVGGDELRTETISEFATIAQGIWRGGIALFPTEAVEGVAIAHVTSSSPVILMVAIATTRDDPDPFARAKRDLDDAQRTGINGLAQEHRQHWQNYWRRSFVQLSNKPFLNQQWFFAQYLLACAWRPGRIAPGLFGSWTWEDFPLFGNDYHWDYNMQQAVWGAYSSNHLEQAVPYNETAYALLPTAQTDALETYGIEGAKFFLVSYPRQSAHNPFPLLHYDRMMSLNGWVAHPMWWYYLYSQDQEYLRTCAYPLMRECAEFYAGYLTRAPDGRYDLWPTAAWDVDFTPHLKHNKNFPMDLSFIRYLMKACLAASEILAVDEDKRPSWSDIADHVRDYPTRDTPRGRVFTAYEGDDSTYHFPLATMMVFPGDDIGLHTPGPLREIALRTLAGMTYSSDEQLLKAVMRVRLGVDDLDVFEEQIRKYTWPNGAFSYPGHWFFWIHACGNALWINEGLLQSYTGQLRLAPAKWKVGARFAHLRTVGAFLVSGEIRPGGDVAYLTITSEAGQPCVVIRPWDDPIRVRELTSLNAVPFAEADGALSFQTEKGLTYVVDRPNDPWETQPVTVISALAAEPAPASKAPTVRFHTGSNG
ncbi:MAG: glycoside hydrolase N-terminal domain-containing protein [Candidatus Latescibacteria bacterium]|nr:glycoside hydrolase N-terminal domain-containing protein [Candidatus Latescibacterota bacterium]